ncbi:MAG: hypothetical protein ACOX3U_01515 [Christensenellales bacterium]|jgi:hypothetical protein
MADRSGYKESIALIKEAESLIRESKNLLNDIKYCIDEKNNREEVDALKEIIGNLKVKNDLLYMENVLLKSKIRELTLNLSAEAISEPLVKEFFNK